MKNRVLAKINSIDQKLTRLDRIEDQIEKVVEKEEVELKKVEGEEARIEQSLVKLGNFTIKRSHFLEITRGTAGAFLGVGLGQALGLSVKLAPRLAWINILGILFFVFVVVGALIYRNDKEFIASSKDRTFTYILKKVSLLYSISLVVVFISLILFGDFPGWNSTLVKALLIGSYPSMSSAAAFTLL